MAADCWLMLMAAKKELKEDALVGKAPIGNIATLLLLLLPLAVGC